MNDDSPFTIKNGPKSTASLIPAFNASCAVILDKTNLFSLLKPTIPPTPTALLLLAINLPSLITTPCGTPPVEFQFGS